MNNGKTLYLALNPDATSKLWVELSTEEKQRYAAAEREIEESSYQDGFEAGREEGYDEGYDAARGDYASSSDDE